MRLHQTCPKRKADSSWSLQIFAIREAPFTILHYLYCYMKMVSPFVPTEMVFATLKPSCAVPPDDL